MGFSGSFKSSKQCLPSPDGKFLATVFSPIVNVRSVESLEIVKVVKLPQDFSGPVLGFQWSPSSRLLMVATVDIIHVFSAKDGEDFQATIRNAVPPAATPTWIGFSPLDTELCVCSSFGLKFGIFDLGSSSRAVEVANPKFFSPATAPYGFSFRPRTHHLALLTRTAGKDMISIHDPVTREVQRSWYPDTVDAQGLEWSPDGKWLVVRESPGQGHKVIFYTADGHMFKTWSGSSSTGPYTHLLPLGPGVRLLRFSPDGSRLALGDSSRSVCLFNMATLSETMRLVHPSTTIPSETIQIWQEQVNISQAGPSIHTFLRATQAISPPARPKDNSESRSGCTSILFDSSSVLVATCLEDFPSTLWIWDIQASELRAVLLFHSNVSSASWHPTSRETLLVRCEGDLYNGIVFVWDPLSEGPRTVDFSTHLPEFKPAIGPGVGGHRSHAVWLNCDASKAPAIFFSDSSHYVLASLGDPEQESPPWKDRSGGDTGVWSAQARREESPLELVPASEVDMQYVEEDDEASELEDTFHYKR